MTPDQDRHGLWVLLVAAAVVSVPMITGALFALFAWWLNARFA